MVRFSCKTQYFCDIWSSRVLLQVYWIGPMIGAVLAGMSHEFFFAESASRQKLVACLTCKDIDFVETTSMTGSSLSTVTQNATRSKQNNKPENNWGHSCKNTPVTKHIAKLGLGPKTCYCWVLTKEGFIFSFFWWNTLNDSTESL